MFSVLVFGITAAITQLVFFREFLSIVSENELTTAVLISQWLVLNGIGTLIGGKLKNKPQLFPYLHIGAVIFPGISILLLRLLRNSVFVSGAAPEIVPFLVFSFMILSPFCILNGVFLPIANALVGTRSKNKSAYPMDCIGGITGGLLFTLILFKTTNPFHIFLIIGILNFIVLIKIKRPWHGLLLLIMVSIPLFCDLNRLTLEMIFRDLSFEKSFPSKYASLRLMKEKDGTPILFSNSRPVYTPFNYAKSEELVHIPMLQVPESSNVLIISGGMDDIIYEVLKHHPKHIDYVELDENILKAGRELGVLKDNPHVQYIQSDTRTFLRETKRIYDCIIMALPEPSTISLNRFFTSEFYMMVKKHIAPGGIVAFSLPGMPDYISKEYKAILSGVRKTLQTRFSKVVFFPGTTTIVLASDNIISIAIDSLLRQRPLDNRFLNSNYLKGYFTLARFEMVNDSTINSPVNMDFAPSLFLKVQERFFREFSLSKVHILIVATIPVLFFLFFAGKYIFMLFSTAFAATGSEVFLLMAFEIHFGTLYFAMSFLFALFMFGLFMGFIIGNRMSEFKSTYAEIAMIAVLPTLIAAMSPSLKHAIPFLLIIISFISGAQMSGLIREKKGSFAVLYWADLMGGALGAFVMGLFFFPTLGPSLSVCVLVLMKIISFCKVRFSK